ncbi:MAG: hypothetical protein GXC72_00865 [Chitinophagaceae bacterium]|nr:hypothetical protein [Chitinophagaceae bacterium]
MAHTDWVPPVTGCEAPLPEVSSDYCDPAIEQSEFTDLYLCEKAGANFTDVTAPAEWADRLADDGTTIPAGSDATVDDLIRHLPIIGDYPKPSIATKDISGGRTGFPYKTTHVINIDVDDITVKNYQFAQFTQSMRREVKAWVKTKGGKMLGGNAGIVAVLRLDPVFARGTDSIVGLSGTLTWDKHYSPDLTASAV